MKLILAAVLFALAPAAFAADSSIGTSGEAWTALVANIAPLLVLVGEKHVKAYFKTMSRPSHYLLYAAGPVGLVTAVVTLLRLYGSGTMRRIIGRQHETRAEALADVTSVSMGYVSQVFSDETIEQTINPDPEDIAIFWCQGKNVAKGKELLLWQHKVLDQLAGTRSRPEKRAKSTGYNAVTCFRGENMEITTVKEVRRLAHSVYFDHIAHIQRSRLESIGNITEDITGISAIYASWPGVSLGLTTRHCLDRRRTEWLRVSVAGICLAVNAVAIALNWRSQRDAQNTTLVSAGVFISVAGSYVTARLVDAQTTEKIIDLSPLKALRTGYQSKRDPNGLTLSTVPGTAVVSEVMRPTDVEFSLDRNKRQRRTFKVLAHTTAIIVVLGYIALYLGLRTSRWWASLAILGTSGVASVPRAHFTPNALRLVAWDSAGRLHPWREWLNKTVREDFVYEDEGPVVSELKFETVSYYSGPRSFPASSTPPVQAPHWYQFFFVNGISLALGLLKRGQVPAEVLDTGLESEVTPGTRSLLSHIPTEHGLYTVPLEAVATGLSQDEELDDIVLLFTAWTWRLQLYYTGPVHRISSCALPYERGVFIPPEQFNSGLTEAGVAMNPEACLWMMTKLIAVSCARYTQEQLENRLLGKTDRLLTADMQNVFLDFVAGAHLAVERNRNNQSTSHLQTPIGGTRNSAI